MSKSINSAEFARALAKGQDGQALLDTFTYAKRASAKFIAIKETPGSAEGLPKFDRSGNVLRKGWRQLCLKDAPDARLALERPSAGAPRL